MENRARPYSEPRPVIRDVLILAAGRGLRMMPFTENYPKPMVKLWGSTLLEIAISNMREVIESIHVTVGYKGALLSDHAISLGVNTVINTEGKGNAWWIFNSVLRNLNKPIFVQTCDNVSAVDYKELQKEYFELGEPLCMVVPVGPVEGFEGDYIEHSGNFVSALSRENRTDTYCSGVQVLNPGRIAALIPSFDDFNDLWRYLIGIQQLMCSSLQAKNWFAIDTLEQLALVDGLRPPEAKRFS